MKGRELSDCCSASVTVEGRTTMHYACDKCGQGCDVYKNPDFVYTSAERVNETGNNEHQEERMKLVCMECYEEYDDDQLNDSRCPNCKSKDAEEVVDCKGGCAL